MINTIETILLGALAGYVTNDVAITMLFDEIKIGPLSVGGVIVKTRDEFEKKIAEMIERDVITHHSLSQELENEEFKKNLIAVFSDYYNYILLEKLQGLKLADIPDFVRSEENCKSFLEDIMPSAIQNFLNLTLDHVTTLDIISDSQIKHIQEQLTLIVRKILQETPILDEYIVGIYSTIENDPIVSIVPEGAIKSFARLANRISTRKVLMEVFDKISETIALKDISDNFMQSVSQKRLKDILGEEQSKNLLANIEENLTNYFNTPTGEQGLLATAEACSEYLKSLDITLPELLSPFFKDELEQFLGKHLPILLEQLIGWVRSKEHEIEIAINESIDESISNYDPMKRALLEGIRKNFLQDITQKFQVVDKIVSALEKTKDDSALAKQFSNIILEKLNSIPISEFFSTVDPTDFIYFYMKNWITNIHEYLPKFLNVHLDKLIPENISEQILGILKNLLLTSKSVDEIFHDELQKGVISVKDKVIRDIFPREVLNSAVPDIKNKLISIIKIDTGIKRYLAGNKRPLSSMLDFSTKTLLSKELARELLDLLYANQEKLENLNFTALLNEIKKNPNIEKSSADFLITILDNNLEQILDGNVSTLVEKNLQNLSSEQMKEMMREFMGKELKPINFFGALLGGTIGGVSTLLPIPQEYLYFSLLQIPVYSVVGYLTNVLAIQGLFRPYTKKFGVSGVIPKEKPRFAKKMGNFVDKELLRRDAAIEMLKNNQEYLLSLLKKRLSKNNFEIINEILDSCSEDIYNYFIQSTADNILKNKDNLKLYLSESILNVKFDDEMLTRMEKGVRLFKELSGQIIRSDLKRFIYSLESSNDELRTIITPHIQDTLNQLMKAKINSALSNLNSLDWKRVLEKANENELKDLDSSVLDKPISTILGRDLSPWKTLLLSNRDQLHNTATSMLQRVLDASGEFLSEVIAQKLKSEVESQTLYITDTTIEYVKSQLSFMEKIGYAALGGDKIIANIVERFCSVKVPELIDKDISEIRGYVETIPKSQFNLTLNNETLYSVCESLIDSLPLQNLSKFISSKTPRELMSYAYLYNFGDLALLFQKEIIHFFSMISEAVVEKKSEITEIIYPAFTKIIEDDVLSLKLKDFLKTLQVKDKVKASYKISNLLLKSELFDEYFETLINKTIDSLEGEKLNIFLSKEELEEALSKFIQNFFSQTDELPDIYYSQKDLPKDILSEFIENIDENSKEYVFGLLLEPFLEALNKHMPDLLSALRIGEITEKAVNNMDNRSLHGLFKSFAQPYFKKLELYGLWGALFAIPGVNILILIKYLLFLRGQKKLAK
jgi:uncharacterized membrane protein YheB (UPF0754 family)